MMTCVTCRILGFLGALAASGASSAQPPPALPDRVDLVPRFREVGLEPAEQGGRDTCSLFAVTALADFECARGMPGPSPRLSAEYLVWAADEATGLKGDQAMFYEAVHGLDVLGICAGSLMPYERAPDAAHRPSDAARDDAKGRSARWQCRWIRRWDLKVPLGDAELLAIKEALAQGHPVACGLRWPKALTGHELLDVPPPDRVFDGHSVAFVGYEDDAKKPGGGTFRFRNSAGPRWGDGGHGVMSYAYVRACANDALWLQFGPPGSESPRERFEAESMDVLAREAYDTSPQGMGAWGGPMWSGGRQLFCGARPGGFVELGFRVRSAGRRRLRVLATAAPDYGRVRVALDGRALEPVFDLYAGRVCPAGSLELGTHELAEGPHRIRFTSAGKNDASAGFAFGLDAVDLLDAK
jgi:hypothetical protein